MKIRFCLFKRILFGFGAVILIGYFRIGNVNDCLASYEIGPLGLEPSAGARNRKKIL